MAHRRRRADELLQFFHTDGNPDFDDRRRNALLRRVHPDTVAGAPRRAPSGTSARAPVPIVGWTSFADSLAREDVEVQAEVDDIEDDYGLDLPERTSGACGDKLCGGASFGLGSAWPVSTRPGGEKMRMLFQFDGYCSDDVDGLIVGEPGPPMPFPGTGWIFVDPGDPDAMAFHWDCD